METTMHSTNQAKKDRISVYLLAAPEDEKICLTIQEFLTPIKRSSKIPIDIYSDFTIPPGEDKEKYKQKLYEADIVLALISHFYIDKDETYERGQKVIERYNKNETILIPILIRNCMWKSTPFYSNPHVKETLLPKNLQPLNNTQFWNSEDDAITTVVSDIYESIQAFSIVEPEPHIAVTAELRTAGEAHVAQPKSEKTETEKSLLHMEQTVVPIKESKSIAQKPQEQVKVAVPIETDWRKDYYKKILWKRAVAFLLDQFLVLVPALVLAGLITVIITGENEPTDDQYAWMGLFDIAFYFMICAAMESSRWRGTFGKMIMKLQITDREGNPISFFRALWRNIIRLLIGYLYGTVIPLVIQYFTFKKSKKLFHDQLSYTVIGERLKN